MVRAASQGFAGIPSKGTPTTSKSWPFPMVSVFTFLLSLPFLVLSDSFTLEVDAGVESTSGAAGAASVGFKKCLSGMLCQLEHGWLWRATTGRFARTGQP